MSLTPVDLRADIPALTNEVYLNFGAHGPSSRRVVDAACDFLDAHEFDSHVVEPYERAFSQYETARERIASFVNADPTEIALTESTTDGVNHIACAMNWEPGDVVVRTDLEHPAGILPWERLKRQHDIEVRVLESQAGQIDLEDYADAVADAKLACFSAVTWSHGTRLPVKQMVDIAKEADTFTLVDAVQVPGQMHFDVTAWGADAVAAAGHKWMLGIWGSGMLYVRKDVASDLVPGPIGSRSVQSTSNGSLDYAAGAGRFEVGTASPLPHVGLVEAIDIIEAIGIERIEQRIGDLTARLKDGLDADKLLSPATYESGLVTIDVDEPDRVVEQLAAQGIRIRSIPSPNAIRCSVHAVSTAEDIDQLLAALKSVE